MSKNVNYTSNVNKDLVHQVLKSIKNDKDLFAFRTALDAQYFNPKLARAYKELNKQGLTLDQIVQKLGLPTGMKNLSMFISRYGGSK